MPDCENFVVELQLVRRLHLVPHLSYFSFSPSSPYSQHLKDMHEIKSSSHKVYELKRCTSWGNLKQPEPGASKEEGKPPNAKLNVLIKGTLTPLGTKLGLDFDQEPYYQIIHPAHIHEVVCVFSSRSSPGK